MTGSDPTLVQLERRLIHLMPSAKAFSGVGFRSASPKYATERDLISGEGSKKIGGRWNPIGIATVYASLTPETAFAEALAHYRYYGIPIADSMPRTFVAIEIHLMAILDLREGDLRRRLRIAADRLRKVDWRNEAHAGREPITQMIGKAAYDGGLEGLIVPSAADPNGGNLLVFPDKLRSGSKISVVNPDRLRHS